MIAIVISRFNKKVTNGLLNGCLKALGDSSEHEVIYVPGVFEIPAQAKQCTTDCKYNAVITLGCVIKGETDHYDYISSAVANGIMNVTLESDIPVVFGILTCQSRDLALERSKGNKRNKGYEAGLAALSMIEKI